MHDKLIHVNYQFTKNPKTNHRAQFVHAFAVCFSSLFDCDPLIGL